MKNENIGYKFVAPIMMLMMLFSIFAVVDFGTTNTNAEKAKTATWTSECVDSQSGGYTGWHDSIAIDGDGKIAIAYEQLATSGVGNLKYAVKSSGAWTKEIVDPINVAAGYGSYLSLAMDSNGKPHIGYSILNSTDYPKYATKASGTWINETTYTQAYAGRGKYMSLALDSNNTPHMSYVHESQGYFGLVYSNKTNTTWSETFVDPPTSDVYGKKSGLYSSIIAIDSAGNPHIAYSNESSWSNYRLSYASMVNGSWVVENVTGANPVAKTISLVLDSSNNPYILFANGTNKLYLASKSDGVWSTTVVDTLSNDTYKIDSVALTIKNGTLYAAYGGYYSGSALKYATNAGGTWQAETIESALLTLGSKVSIVIGSDGTPHISYCKFSMLYYATKGEAQAQAPAAPTITLASTDSDGSYTVSWTESTGATYYVLEESNAYHFLSSTVAYNGSSTTKDITGKSNGTYYYRVKAGSAVGVSDWSNTPVVTVTITSTTSDTKPSVPTITLATTDADGAYTVTWSASTGATYYVLQENETVIYNGTGTSKDITGKTNGTYSYNVKAGNATGESAWSAMKSITVTITTDGTESKPSAPIITLDTTDADGAYTVTWAASTGATYYVIQENETEIYNGSGTTKDVTGKKDGTYVYRVKAGNSSGESAWSEAKTITVTIVVGKTIPTEGLIEVMTNGSCVNLSVKSAVHKVTLTSISTSSVTLRIESSPIDITLSGGDEKNVDTDGNGKNDLSVKLKSITVVNGVGTNADIVFKQLTEPADTTTAAKGFMPGFEVVALLCIAGVSAVIVRRRH